MITFEKYMTFTPTTNTYKDKDMNDCLELGLLEEIGEFAGKIKKMHRDDNGVMTIEKHESLIKELGDIAWYTAEILNKNIKGIPKSEYSLSFQYSRPTRIEQIPVTMNTIYINRSSWSSFYLNMLFCISIACEFLNTTPDHVFSENIKKLKSRQDRGVLHGSGDDR